MVFKCQENSYLQEFSSIVKSCDKATMKTISNGKKAEIQGYNVVMEDTVLFPEGGGQPCDYGWLNDKEVLQVNRRLADALHFVKEPFDVGSVINQKINWKRRFDHMQQHSGQHLLSAIFEREHDIKTTSWWLGEEESYVELNCISLSPELIQKVEDRCNHLIREAIPVTVKVCELGDPELDEAHTRGLPEDHSGSIRIITILGVDENLCCGTHVGNLSELQVMKLTRAENGKKNCTNLKFLVGSRVISTLQKCLDREQAMTALLKNDSSKHIELVEKLQKSLKIANKSLHNTLVDIATMEADQIKSQIPIPQYACFNRKDGDMDYIKSITRAFDGIDICVFVAIGDGKSGGNIYLQGNEKHVAELAPKLCEIVNGKGAVKGSKYQAKVQDLTNVAKCDDIIKTFFSNLPV